MTVFILPLGGIYVDALSGLGCFLRRVEVTTSEADPTSFRCCRCLIRLCRPRMGRYKILLEYLEGEEQDSVPFQNTGSRMPRVALVRIVIETGRDLITETLRRPSPALTMFTIRTILTNTTQEGAQGIPPLQALDHISLPLHTTLPQDRSLTS